MKRERVRAITVFAVAVGCLVVLSLSPIVFASFSCDYKSGDWSIAEVDEWWDVIRGDRSGEVAFSDTVVDFTGYHATINFTMLNAIRAEWWHLRSEKRVTLLYNFSGVGGEMVYVYFDFINAKESWGFFNDYWLRVGISNSSAFFKPNWWFPSGVDVIVDDLLLYPSYVELWVYEDSDVLKIQVLNQRADSSIPVNMGNVSYPVGAGWFGSVKITEYVYHVGYGRFKGGLSFDVHDTPYSPSIPSAESPAGYTIWDFINELGGIFTNNLPAYLQEWIATLGGWFSWLIDAIPFFTDFIGVIIPILPYFLLFWILDAVASCVLTGNVSPLGVCFTTLLGLGANIVNGLVTIIGTLYDFIHFW